MKLHAISFRKNAITVALLLTLYRLLRSKTSRHDPNA
jgi:hypothetical protein